jgi:hypothetical protein
MIPLGRAYYKYGQQMILMSIMTHLYTAQKQESGVQCHQKSTYIALVQPAINSGQYCNKNFWSQKKKITHYIIILAYSAENMELPPLAYYSKEKWCLKTKFHTEYL